MSLQKQFIKSNKVCKVTFRLPANRVDGAHDVKVLGDFNKWNLKKGIPMKVENGEFLATMELPVGKEYQFRYLIDDQIWENDTEADKYAPTPFGVENSVILTSPPIEK